MSAGLLLPKREPVERGMGEQFMAWGAVDGALALAGMWMGRRRQAMPGNPERELKDAETCNACFWSMQGWTFSMYWAARGWR